MTRGILSLALVLLGATTANAGATCELDSTDAVAHAVNAALAIWASDKRCSGPTLTEAPVKCVQDVSTSIEELTRMGTAIGDMIGDCGGLKLEHMACSRAGDEVFAATAGLTDAAAAIADKCAHVAPKPFDGDILDTATTLGKCTAEAGDSMNSFFHAHNSIQELKDHCESGGRRRRRKGGKCTVDALDVTGVLASFGEYIADAYSDCEQYHTKTEGDESTEAAECAAAVLHGVASLTELSRLGLQMKDKCKEETSRLFLEGNNVAASATGSPLALALGAIIPVAAVLSFIAGSRFAKSREVDARDAGLPVLLE